MSRMDELCNYCRFPLSAGEHGVFGPSDQPGKIKVSCRVPIDVAQPPPVVDVLYGTGTFKAMRCERLIDES